MPAGGGGGKACIPGYGAIGKLGPAVGKVMGGIRAALVAMVTAAAGSSDLTGNAGAAGAAGT